ncbi:MAG: SGNH/GDSL hydrolase family protein [Acidimicrobiia bacterium]|nr:SGNH/GDSL hydrolase family protein [Acidimicrobiia bacterium]
MKTLTVLLGLPASLVAGVIAFFTYGEVTAGLVLGIWLILLFTSAAVMPKPALALLAILQLAVMLGGGLFIVDQARTIVTALTTTEGPVDPADAAALAAADHGLDIAMGETGFRLELHETEITAMVQDGLAESDAPLRKITIDIVDSARAGVGRIDFVGEFKSGGTTVRGSVRTTIEAGAVQVEVISLEMGALNLPSIGQNAMEEAIDGLLEQIADVNELLADSGAEVQSVVIGNDRLVVTGVRTTDTVITSGTLLAGIRQQAAEASSAPEPPREVLEPGVVNGTTAEGDAYYVALGDSLAANVGVADPRDGYVSRLHRWLQESDGEEYGLRNFGVSGETSGTLIRGGQLDAALAFMRNHEVAYVTIDIGANDLLGHLGSEDCSVDLAAAACRDRIDSSRAAYTNNIEEVFRRLRSAAPEATIVFLRAYNPFSLGFGPGVGFEAQSNATLDAFNDLAAAAAARHSILVADGFTPMVGTTASTTHMLDNPPDIHPRPIGYDVLAVAITLVIG